MTKEKNEEQVLRKKLTVFLPESVYLDWKRYEMKALETGKKISFQSIVEAHIRRITKRNKRTEEV